MSFLDIFNFFVIAGFAYICWGFMGLCEDVKKIRKKLEEKDNSQNKENSV